MGRSRLIAPLLVAAWTSISPAQGVLFHETADPTHNTTAPADDLSGSGWQWQGTWGGFLGTAVGPRHFLTAKHIGGAVGNPFTYRGKTFAATAVARDPESDLALWRVCGLLPDFAPLMTGTNEVSADAVLIGRGTARGAEVTLTNDAGVLLRGWRWGAGDGRQRWGRNRIDAVADGGDGIGELLQARFETNGLPDECHLSTGDSGGALFLREDGAWKLAGVHYAVDGPYSHGGEESDPGFNAALFDESGLYIREDTEWIFRPEQPQARPGTLYSTRISARSAWIQAVLNQTLPESERIVLLSAPTPDGPFAEETEAVVHEAERTATLPEPATNRFFQLRTCFPTRIVSAQLHSNHLVLTFE